MKETVLKLVLMLLSPVLRALASRIPDAVLQVTKELEPIIDQVQKDLADEAARRGQ